MRGARPERSLERELERGGVVRPHERVLIACSGGPDSVALTAAMHAVAERMHLDLHVAFVNHGRRESAWQDECVVLQVAARLELPVEILAPQPESGDEQRLRTLRYESLTAAAQRAGTGAIATAHHAEDQTETVLLALLRGSGPAGLHGMRGRRALAEDVDLIRPFLGIPPAALLEYCHARALPYAVDPTNAQMDLRRNAVREALAVLRPLFPGLDAAVSRAASIAGDERLASPRAHLRQSVRDRLEREAELRDLDFVHVEAAVRAIEEHRTGSFHMKPGVELRIERGAVIGIKRR